MAERSVEEWPTIGQAAALGLFGSGFRALARRETIVVRRRGPLPGVQLCSLRVHT